MKINLAWGLIQFEIGEESSMVGFVTAAVAVILVVITMAATSYCTNPDRLNCVEQNMNHVGTYNGC